MSYTIIFTIFRPSNKAKDYTGQKFNRLIAIKPISKQNRSIVWLFKCDCGEYKEAIASEVYRGSIRTCGNCRGSDLTGRRFGKLLVIKRMKGRKLQNRPVWECLCDCGKTCYKRSTHLIYNDVFSCGCLTQGENNVFYIDGRTKRRDHKHTYQLKKKYGLERDDYYKLLEKQDGKCAICFGQPKGKSRLSVDHCHKTGKIRGLLCSNCNSALGLFKDDINLVENAKIYLRKNNGRI